MLRFRGIRWLSYTPAQRRAEEAICNAALGDGPDKLLETAMVPGSRIYKMKSKHLSPNLTSLIRHKLAISSQNVTVGAVFLTGDFDLSVENKEPEVVKSVHELSLYLLSSSKQIVGTFSGKCSGVGYGVFASSTFRLATESIAFSLRELLDSKTLPVGGFAYHIASLNPAVGVEFARYLAVTGEKLGQEDMFRLGLVSYAVEEEAAFGIAGSLAHTFSHFKDGEEVLKEMHDYSNNGDFGISDDSNDYNDDRQRKRRARKHVAFEPKRVQIPPVDGSSLPGILDTFHVDSSGSYDMNLIDHEIWDKYMLVPFRFTQKKDPPPAVGSVEDMHDIVKSCFRHDDPADTVIALKSALAQQEQPDNNPPNTLGAPGVDEVEDRNAERKMRIEKLIHDMESPTVLPPDLLRAWYKLTRISAQAAGKGRTQDALSAALQAEAEVISMLTK